MRPHLRSADAALLDDRRRLDLLVELHGSRPRFVRTALRRPSIGSDELRRVRIRLHEAPQRAARRHRNRMSERRLLRSSERLRVRLCPLLEPVERRV
jgi:hypothetical protein